MLIFWPYLLILFMTFLPSLANDGPSIFFTKERYSQGQVRQGVRVNQTFEFINCGDGDLIIEKLVPS